MRTASIRSIVAGWIVAVCAANAVADVRISQIWGGGGLSTGTPNADYVVLFNTDLASAAALAGWSIQISPAGGTTWSKVDLAGTIAPRGYFLVQLTASGATGTPMTPDQTGALSAAALLSSAGKAALVNNQTLLTGACPWPAPSIVDFVGYGTTAVCREGTDADDNAPGGSATGAGQTPSRRCGGLADSNVNGVDFELRPPAPRNSSSPQNPGIGFEITGAADPHALPAGANLTLSVSLLLCDGISTGGVVNVDATLIGAGVVSLLDDGLPPDDVAGDLTFTGNAVADGQLPPAEHPLPFTYSDNEDRIGNGTIGVTITQPNDACGGAQAIAIPSTTGGTTVHSTPDSDAYTGPICGTTLGTGGGVWYSLVGTGNTITIDTCDIVDVADPYDTKLHVFCGDCESLLCVGGNDDGPAGCGVIGSAARGSSVSFCSQTGASYRVLVSGFGSAVGDFRLRVADDGTPCIGGVSCLPTGRCCLPSGSCVATTRVGCDAVFGGYGGDGTNCGGAVFSFPFTGADVAIPDNDPAGATMTIAVAQAAAIDQLRVEIDVQHTWVGDLRATVDDGTQTVTLFFDTGDPVGTGFGDSSNLNGVYRFYDAAPGHWWTAAAQGDSAFVLPGGDYRPAAALTGGPPTPSLAIFAGQPYTATWTLRVADVQSGDTGILRGFRIFSTATQDPCDVTCLPGCDPSDLDENCAVNLSDLTTFLSAFGGPGPIGDFDMDGGVGLSDLVVLLSQFGNNCN